MLFAFLSINQVTSDLLHVWFLVRCVFNSAVDRVRDHDFVVLFPSLCRGKDKSDSPIGVKPRSHDSPYTGTMP